MLTVLVSTISNAHLFLLKKCEKLLQMQKLHVLTLFSKIISVYAIFNDQSFDDTLTNDIVSFEQLSPCQDVQLRGSMDTIECIIVYILRGLGWQLVWLFDTFSFSFSQGTHCDRGFGVREGYRPSTSSVNSLDLPRIFCFPNLKSYVWKEIHIEKCPWICCLSVFDKCFHRIVWTLLPKVDCPAQKVYSGWVFWRAEQVKMIEPMLEIGVSAQSPKQNNKQCRSDKIQWSYYSRTSMARTPMARLSWLIRTHFLVLTEFVR